VPPGVDTFRFRNLKFERSEKTVFFVSVLDRFHEYKGLDILLKAIKILKEESEEVILWVGGQGERMRNYIEMTRKLDIEKEVKFFGYLPENKLIELYNRCSCFVLPSKSSIQEGFGIVALEALSCETPVVVSKLVGVAEDVERFRCGFAVEPNEYEIADAILSLSDSRVKMGKRGRRLILKKYSWDSIVTKIEKIYFKVLEEKK